MAPRLGSKNSATGTEKIFRALGTCASSGSNFVVHNVFVEVISEDKPAISLVTVGFLVVSAELSERKVASSGPTRISDFSPRRPMKEDSLCLFGHRR